MSLASRRSIVGVIAAMVGLPLGCRRDTRWDPECPRRLELTNLRGGDRLTVTFHEEEDVAPDAMAALRHLLRDYRRNEEHAMDFGLFMQLTDLARQCGVAARYEVISGYRAPATNKM